MAEKVSAKQTPVQFRVSAGLKRIIGRDLITNEFVAILELVKNSIDAGATRIDLGFFPDKIYVVDNGKGMSRKDITDKWLFVAYSAKSDDTEDETPKNQRSKTTKKYAGSKGVGRFSSDRLGSKLRMQTKSKQQGSVVEVIDVDWDKFEANPKNQFINVSATHRQAVQFDLPKEVGLKTNGTAMEISSLRESWDRDRILELKSVLAKLVNPFNGAFDNFQIRLICPTEQDRDRKELETDTEESASYSVVNGVIRNFIFDTLKGKTTLIELRLSADGKAIETQLNDRGSLIYSIREPSEYSALSKSGLRISLFFLNHSAKLTFKRRTGVDSVQFGSVFLFKNGFRVFPIGDEGVDTFGLDRRKQQGYARLLGTRDIIGRIDVSGGESEFRESSSRDSGLISTPAYEELKKCLIKNCLARLEKYVVGVTFPDREDKEVSDTSRLKTDDAAARIAEVVASLVGGKKVQLLEYNKDLIRIINAKSENFQNALGALRTIAEKAGQQDVLREIVAAGEKHARLVRSEQQAREKAEEERQARLAAETKAAEERNARRVAEQTAVVAQQKAVQAQKGLEEERKRALFLESLQSLDTETVVLLHHQIGMYAVAAQSHVAAQMYLLNSGRTPSKDDLITMFQDLDFQIQRILSASQFVTKANFRLQANEIHEDLPSYVAQYVQHVARIFSASDIKAKVVVNDAKLKRRFKPIDVAVLVDNMISNAVRAKASSINFLIGPSGSDAVEIRIQDDGPGFSSDVDLRRIFEKGYTRTKGSGMGLYHVEKILKDMGGTIEVVQGQTKGACFLVRVPVQGASNAS